MVTGGQLIASLRLENESGILYYLSQYENGTGDYFLAEFINGTLVLTFNQAGSTIIIRYRMCCMSTLLLSWLHFYNLINTYRYSSVVEIVKCH